MHKYRFAAFAISLSLLPFAAFADGSVTVTPPYPGATVNAGTRVSFSVVASGFTGPVTYRVVDSFGGGANSGNIDGSGAFFYGTNQSDVGTHTLTITVTDAAGLTGSVTQTFTVQSGPTATLQAATSSVVIGTQVSFTTGSQGLFSPGYTVADSFAGSSLRPNAVNADGTFVWTPLWQDVGTHTITVTAKDGFGYTATASQKITVVSGLPAPAVVATPSTTPAAPVVVATTSAKTAPSTSTRQTAKASAYAFTKFLTVGSTGAEVTALQKALIAGGYLSGSATGYFGQLTKRATAAYQAAHGLVPVGYVGPGTRAALNRGN